MSILLFIVILVALILVHEFGHFVVAKLSGMRVDEFGIGYPPKAWSIKKGETEYSLNWLPFGGFVRIFGEDAEDGTVDERAFFRKPRFLQALTLIAGIAMNLVLAYVLLIIVLGMGAPRALESHQIASTPDAYVLVSSVMPGSPAEEAKFEPGDRIVSARSGEEVFTSADSQAFTEFVGSHESITFTLENRGVEREVVATPRAGLSAENPDRRVLGVGVASVGTVKTPWLLAPVEALQLTASLTYETALGLLSFFGSIFTLTADLAQVSGPVGIAGAVGDASSSGLAQLLTLTAVISINLALINLLPIPALDGGRLLFVLIESVIRRPLPRPFQNAVNAIGFVALIILMLVVTASDIWKLWA